MIKVPNLRTMLSTIKVSWIINILRLNATGSWK